MSTGPSDQKQAVNEEEEEDFSEIECTFGFFDPVPTDIQTISVLIPRYVPVNRLEIARAVATQKAVGTVIKDQLENGMPGDSFFGFNSVLNLATFKEYLPSLQGFIQWMCDLGDASLSTLLTTQLDKVGWVINERAQGVPEGLAPHLMRGLFEEIEWATEDLETEEERNQFKFTHYLFVKKVPMTEDGLVFLNIEDDYFYKAAAIKVEFKTDGEEGDLDGVDYHRMIYVVDANIVPEVRRQLNEVFMIDESQYADEGRK